MIKDVDRVSLALQQLERLLRALEDLRENVLPRDPALFATMAEAPLDDLDRLRQELAGFLHETKSSA
ncbi:MAG: hypothetical protein WD049_00480 [Candidatus Paceibacterota bacterium]